MKTCTTCKEDKPLDGFNKRKSSGGGLEGRCRECEKARAKAWYADNKERKAKTQATWKAANKDSRAEANAAWYAANKERVAENNAAWRADNKELMAATHAAYKATWSADNRGVVNAACANRRALKLQQTPAWADHEAINNHYLWAACMKEVMGVDVHVDHEVPLNNPLVSGLHTHDNLQLLSAEANLRKSNKFEAAA